MSTSRSNQWSGRKIAAKGSRQGFSGAALACAAALAAGVAAFGAYSGIQAMRASSWESDAVAAKSLVAGAAGIGGQERRILAQREASSQAAVAALAGREQALEFLVGKPAPLFAESRLAAVAASRARIDGAVSMEAAIARALDMRSKGASASEFIGMAQAALASSGIHRAAGKFSGPAGFASLPVAAVEARARESAADADARLAKLQGALPALARALQADGGQAELSSRVAAAAEEARSLARSEALAQIERYRNTVKESAKAAFSREGESMGSSDWREINDDLERDPEWRLAKAGLLSAAASSASDAESIARSAWEEERARALDMAALVSAQPASMGSMTVWEMAALALWAARSPGSGYQSLGSGEGLVSAGPSAFARQGYSLGAEPRSGLDGKSALRLAQGDALPQLSTRFANSGAIASLASRAAAMAGDSARADRLARDAGSRSAQSPGRYSPADAPAARAPKPAPSLEKHPAPSMPTIANAGSKASPDLKWDYQAALNAGRAAEMAAKASAARAAISGANGSAQALAKKTADKAALASAGRASSSLADRAAKEAASKAAQATANRSASTASDKAAYVAAGRAATSAAGKAATSAASKAASSAASKAASSAASKAASSAASKAASSAASKAASSAASKAASSAASRASTSSSSSRR